MNFFRFGHSLVSENFQLGVGPIPLVQTFNFHQVTLNPGLFPSDYLSGMSQDPSELQDHVLTDTLTNRLFASAEDNFGFGNDLYSLNIQRGRDHGLPSYNAFREICGLAPFTSFQEMSGQLYNEAITALSNAYQ